MEAIERSISFRLRGVDGKVQIRYEMNGNPSAWGFDQLGVNYDWSVARGFPVIEGRVQYVATGYLGYLGWIQAVDYVVRRGPGQEAFVVAPEASGHCQYPNPIIGRHLTCRRKRAG